MDWELQQKLIRVAYQYKLDEHDFTIVEDTDWEYDGNHRSRATIILHFSDYYKVYQREHVILGYMEFIHPVVVTKVRRKEVTTTQWVNV